MLMIFLFKIKTKLVRKEEDQNDECGTDEEEAEPMPHRCELIEGDVTKTENDRCDSDASANDDRGNEPLKRHLKRSGDHSKRVVGEDGEEHHNREENDASVVKKVGCLLAILFTEKLFTYMISADPTGEIHKKAGGHNADKGNKKRLPLSGIQRSEKYDKRHRSSGNKAEHRGNNYLNKYDDKPTVPRIFKLVEKLGVELYSLVNVNDVKGAEYKHRRKGKGDERC